MNKKIEKEDRNIVKGKAEFVIQLKLPEGGEKGQNVTIEKSTYEEKVFYITSESGIRDLGKEVDLQDGPWGLGIKVINKERVKDLCEGKSSLWDGTDLEHLTAEIEWEGKDGNQVRISTEGMDTTQKKLAKIEGSLESIKESLKSGDFVLENYSVYDI
jgi:hypothetical protein